MTVRVVTAAQSAARDRSAISAGTPSFELMQLAGTAAASLIADRLARELQRGVVVFCGPGNNGGDGWVVARALAQQGVPVRVSAPEEPRTPDARTARSMCDDVSRDADSMSPPGVVVDALLGTGASGPLRGDIAIAASRIRALRSAGAIVVSLDLPTGLDASSGALAEGHVEAALTISFGTMKRGHLVAREACGAIDVVDIGLGEHAELADGAPRLVDADWVFDRVPRISPTAHKGDRKKLMIVGGAHGMAGAVALASKAAFRAGIGMVRACVAPESIGALQSTVIEATASPWPPDGTDFDLSWCDVLLLGPGLGAGRRDLLARLLDASPQLPVVLDADALTAWVGDVDALARRLAGRPAVLTPHAAEMARLAACSVDQVLARRWEIGADLAQRLGAVVLLKGVPTVISGPNEETLVSARGTAALATGGSGDVLGGITATLLAQMGDPQSAAACAAFVHGRAAEIACAGRSTRGVTLGEVIDALGHAWRPAASLDDGARTLALATLPSPTDA